MVEMLEIATLAHNRPLFAAALGEAPGSLPASDLRWRQPHALKMHFELLRGEQRAATLHFEGLMGGLKSSATGRSADGAWSFRAQGFFRRRTVVQDDAGTVLATLQRNTWNGGGSLALATGARYTITSNAWYSQFQLQDAAGGALLRLSRFGVMRTAAQLEIEPRAAQLKELPWLTLLLWYHAVMARTEAMM